VREKVTFGGIAQGWTSGPAAAVRQRISAIIAYVVEQARTIRLADAVFGASAVRLEAFRIAVYRYFISEETIAEGIA